MKLQNTAQAFTLEIEPTNTNQIHIKPKTKDEQSQHENSQSLSSNTFKHKLPQIILKYIIQQAKQKRNDIPLPTSNRFKQVASKMTQLKKGKSIAPNFKCEICQMQVSQKQKLTIGSCGHPYCASCLHQYVIYKIQRFQKVQCPQQSCTIILDQKSTCYTQLPLETRKKFKKIMQYNQSVINPNRKLCPNQQCQGFLELPQPQQNIIIIKNPQCNTCMKSYCSQCNFQQHQGQCDPHHLTFFQNTLHYRQCSKCKNVIEKSSGCNHMTCKCGYQFCYICGYKWKQSHTCQNPQGQPLFQQPQFQCCCCTCNCNCCNICCQNCQNCIQECCQCFCRYTCFPLNDCLQQNCGECCQQCCQTLQNCPCCTCCQYCQCCGCQCNCIESLCCNILLKTLFILLIIVTIIPAVILYTFFNILFKIIIGMLGGLVAFHCILEQQQIQYNWKHVIIGILILPITIIFLMGLGIYSMFSGQGTDQIKEIACLPCSLFKSVVWEEDD